jgi:hypothetical protein
MKVQETNGDESAVLALAALGWILADQARADRLLALTGLTPETLRDRIEDHALLAATLRFLEGHEPDLLASSASLGVSPSDLVEARRRLEA